MTLLCITNLVWATKLEDGNLELGITEQEAVDIKEFPEDWDGQRALSWITEENKRTQKISSAVKKPGEIFITKNKILSSRETNTVNS